MEIGENVINKFAKYLYDNDLEIYDVAKILRDSEWNKSSKQPRTREAFVRLLWFVPIKGWATVNAYGERNKFQPAVYNYTDGHVTAWRVAQELGCKERDIS